MDENTIFQNPTGNQTPPSPPPVTPPPSKPPPNVSPPNIPPPTYDEIPEENGLKALLLRGNIIKLLIGVVVVILIGVIIFGVILPLFGKKNEKITLTYWGLWEDSKVMAPLISEFEKQNPNIKVNYSQQDVKQYRERLTTRINNGSGPDIFRFHNTWYPMLSSVLLPIPNDVITKDQFNKNFFTVCQEDLIKNGAIYGIPLSIDTLAMYVNNDLFQKAGLSVPATWVDFVSAARSLTVKDQGGNIQTAGAAMGTFNNIVHAPDIVSLLLLQNGANLSNLNSTSAKAGDALTFYTSFAKDDGVWQETLDPSLLAFSQGNLAMFFGYSWDYFSIKAANPNLNFKIVPVPQLPGQNINLASYWAEGVSVKSKYQKEALLFLKYLTQKDTAEKLYSQETKVRAFGEPYARVDSAALLSNDPLLSPFVSQAKTAKSSFFVDSTHDNGLNSQMNSYLGNAVNSVLGNTSPQTAIETLSKGTDQVLKQYGQ